MNGGPVERVRLVVACTDRKRVASKPELMVRSLRGTLERRAERWASRVAAADAGVCARELYAGEHWSVVRQLDEAGRGGSVEIWIASAGLGLIRIDDRVCSYAATFANGGPDSVQRYGEPARARADWWALLAQFLPRRAGPSTIADLAAEERGAPLIVALSDSYWRAVEPDVRAAAGAMSSADKLTVISTGSAQSDLVVPTDARLARLLGGSMLSLNARIAAHLIDTFRPRDLDRRRIAAHLAELVGSQPPLERPVRAPLSDEAVSDFIRQHAVGVDGARPSASRLLRELRDSGRACEQKRFGVLYRSVMEDT